MSESFNVLHWLYFGIFLICFQIFVPSNPRGAETLPPGIVVSETDYMLRRLWGDPTEVTSSPFFFAKEGNYFNDNEEIFCIHCLHGHCPILNFYLD